MDSSSKRTPQTMNYVQLNNLYKLYTPQCTYIKYMQRHLWLRHNVRPRHVEHLYKWYKSSTHITSSISTSISTRPSTCPSIYSASSSTCTNSLGPSPSSSAWVSSSTSTRTNTSLGTRTSTSLGTRTSTSLGTRASTSLGTRTGTTLYS